MPLGTGLAASEAGARNIALVLGLGLAVLLGIITFIANRFIFRPLHQMAQAAQGIAKGDLD